MSHILGVKFKDYGQTYHFDSGAFVVSPGDSVLVETEQGLGLGKVVEAMDALPEGLDPESVKTIFKVAAEEDVQTAMENDALAKDSFRFCRGRIRERGLEMKLVDVEVFFDRSKMIFYFTAPGRIDFRELVKDLVREYRTRIELRQIGVRHETQMLGAVGNCGQVCCCRRFLRKFEPVTIKMAKEQNLFLNPSKISGICGRLLCCLAYEQQNYEHFQKQCPKTGKKFQTTLGTVKVLRTNFFRQSVTILPENGDEQELSVEEWTQIIGRSQDKGPEAGDSQTASNADQSVQTVAGSEAQEELAGSDADALLDIPEDAADADGERKAEAKPNAPRQGKSPNQAQQVQQAQPQDQERKGKSRRRRRRKPKGKGSDQAE